MSTHDSWMQFLDPEVTRPRLISLSLYLAAYEALEASIVERLKGFYCFEMDGEEWVITDAYKTKVLARNASVKHASLDWLIESGVIDDSDMQAFKRFKACRNEVAHKLWTLTAQNRFPDGFVECFEGIASLVRKIEVWWIVNFELEINPDFDGKEVDESLIVPGPCMMLDMLRQIALGTDKEASVFLEGFRTLNPSASSAHSAVNP